MRLRRRDLLAASGVFIWWTAVPAAAAPRPGHVTGKVTDSRGKPVANAEIAITGTTNAGRSAAFTTQTDAKGEYAQRVPDGVYRINAWVNREYNGKKYQLTLHPQDGDIKRSLDSAKGAVKDFTWKLSGMMGYSGLDEKEGGSYYGGHLSFEGGDPLKVNAPPLEFPQGSSVEITLTPDGPLIDGSAGKPVVFKKAYQSTRLNFVSYQQRRVLDVPIGRYTVTARLLDPQGTAMPLRVSVKTAGEDAEPLADAARVDFPPYKTSTPGILSGVEGVSLYLLR